MIPAVYLSFTGELSAKAVVFAALGATVISDSVWYFVGRFLKEEKILGLRVVAKRQELLERGRHYFARYGSLIIVASKFIYGTRTAVQIIAGIEKIPFFRYLAVNAFAVLLWIGVLYGIGWIINIGLLPFELSVNNYRIVFSSIFIIIIALVIWTSYRLGKRFQSSSRHSTKKSE